MTTSDDIPTTEIASQTPTTTNNSTGPLKAASMSETELPIVAGGGGDGWSDDETELVPVEDALAMIAQGEEDIKMKEYSAAADQLSQAVASLSAHYGDGAAECARALHLYGIALYYLAIEKSSVFGNMEQDKANLGPEAMEAATAAMVELLKKGPSRFVFGGDGEAQEVEDTAEPAGDEEALDDLELSYEVLTVAANAYQIVDSEENRKSLADVYLYLGHYHLESDRPNEAKEEYLKALNLKLELKGYSDRELSEARYIYAITLEATGQYESALEQVKLAVADLQKRLDALIATGAAGPKGKQAATEQSLAEGEEVKELNEMKQDLEAKVEEIKMKIEAAKNAKDTVKSEVDKATGGQDGPMQAQVVNAKPVADISGLVKKRKMVAEEPAQEEETDAKKPKMEDAPSV
ncbi:hypothetical protein PhCBS80983_g05644 [Powellomyces hirtus]|uniref:Tetratricopeptide SHNi-TPR domain-containing protein n=1 Tax=Powellomyces hirtus TaxID=109895 RepID=A0A507DV25_9FUNG|nr:hypothetical protein PhCBS80983_g05644 [Powellomyces hirtus]